VGDKIEIESGSLRVTKMKGRRVEYLLFVPRRGEAD
jgi:CBS domain containing-hemolysin-like protein